MNLKKLKLIPLSVLFFMLTACTHTDWRTADRSSAGLAPKPEITKDAVVHVYAARTMGWRGVFAVHAWIATKEKNADHYVTYHVMGYRLKRTGTVVVIEKDIPDRKWFGAEPILVDELIGEAAEKAIPQIHQAALNYPYANRYSAWPGPNSNTFISHIIRNTEQLGVELPSHAIGKDWLINKNVFSSSESKTGYQFSILGSFGLILGLAEGIELNILGLSLGLDFRHPALKMPFLGRLGIKDAAIK